RLSAAGPDAAAGIRRNAAIARARWLRSGVASGGSRNEGCRSSLLDRSGWQLDDAIPEKCGSKPDQARFESPVASFRIRLIMWIELFGIGTLVALAPLILVWRAHGVGRYQKLVWITL